MPPITKENDTLTATPEIAARPSPAPVLPGEAAVKQQPVALEVTVTVNGARAVDGSDKREPFSETTKTVLVFGNGAVIRLSSSVAPGQLLFLTNEKTKKEVVCQVVKSKNYRNVSGYVELEFTESVVGFWGMRFPGDRIGPGPQSAPSPIAVRPPALSGSPVPPRPAAPNVEVPAGNTTPSLLAAKPPVHAPVGKDAEPKLSESKFVASKPPEMGIPAPPNVQAPAAPKLVAPLVPVSTVPAALSTPEVSLSAPPAQPIALPAPAAPEATVDLVPAQPVMSASSTLDFPRTSEAQASILEPPRLAPAFPTLHLADFPAVPEMEPPKPAIVHSPLSSDPETEALKQQTARLQEQLSSLLFAEPVPASPTKPAQKSPAAPFIEKKELVGSAKQVQEAAKVPEAVLTTEKPAEPEITPPVSLPSPLDEEELKIPAWLEPLARNAVAPASTQELILREKAKRYAEQAKTFETASEPVAAVKEHPKEQFEEQPIVEMRLPSFGDALPIDGDESTGESAPTNSGKGLLIGAIAAGALLLAGAGWWYMRPQADRAPATASQASKAPAPLPSAPADSLPAPLGNTKLGANPSMQTMPAAQNTSIVQANSAPASLNVVPSGASITTARNSQLPASSENGGNPVPASVSAQPAPTEAKKPVLGEVRLAAPKVAHRRTVQNGAEPDAGLTLNDEPSESSAEALNAGLVAGTRQPAAPAAPLPVGGDVKPAKLISSTPPVYPILAKNQHISGNVVVDALIDANGRVTTMKVISGPTLLQQAAMDALKQWKYQPATLDGKATAMHLTVTLQFRLQ